MPQSFSAAYLHLIFSTKNREAFLRDPGIRRETHSYLGGISKELDCPPVIVGGVEDHVHILARHGRGITQSDWVKEVKRASSLWIKERDSKLNRFSWQAGFGVFSVSSSNVEDVEHYIANQEEHHRKISFQDEYRAFLTKHGIECDERYMWD